MRDRMSEFEAQNQIIKGLQSSKILKEFSSRTYYLSNDIVIDNQFRFDLILQNLKNIPQKLPQEFEDIKGFTGKKVYLSNFGRSRFKIYVKQINECSRKYINSQNPIFKQFGDVLNRENNILSEYIGAKKVSIKKLIKYLEQMNQTYIVFKNKININ